MMRSTAQHSIPALGDTRCALVCMPMKVKALTYQISGCLPHEERENDDHLPRPFAGKSQLTYLTSWRMITTTVKPPDMEVSGRVVDEER